jgi:hypothetical protein
LDKITLLLAGVKSRGHLLDGVVLLLVAICLKEEKEIIK